MGPDVVFVFVLGLLTGGASVILIQQFVHDAFAPRDDDERTSR